jgi:putative oxidoreductase
LTLAAHGAQKLFGWFGGPGLEKTGYFFEMLGFHPGRRFAFLAAFVEVMGGVLLTVGLFTPLAATLLASVMLVAAATSHFKNGFFLATGGYEFNLVLGVTALSVAFTGPGSLSVDSLIGLSVNGALWGLAALVVSAGGGAIQIARRRPAAATTQAVSA